MGQREGGGVVGVFDFESSKLIIVLTSLDSIRVIFCSTVAQYYKVVRYRKEK